MSTTSLLQTALQNLHVSQQVHQQSHTPRPPSSPGSSRHTDLEHDLESVSSRGGSPNPGLSEDETDDDELISVGKGTRPGTPTGKGLQLGQRLPSSLGGKNTKDPLRFFPTHIAVRIFLTLDVKTLARCDRVSKRWHKSSTLNYVWFLQNRALVLPRIALPDVEGGKTRKVDQEIEFFDPYDKTPRLSSLPTPPMPSTPQPQWTKMESKRSWKTTFKNTFKRTDPTAEPEVDSRRVDISSLHSSGFSTPGGGGPGGGSHGYSGLGSGSAARWAEAESEAALSSTEKKVIARENYKALGGRKSKTKRKMGGTLGSKDKGGAVEDGRFEAPW
ncbi:hypothetical protein CI109_106960 [Kwoniella shandongensis]|uniref:Uncharacterized protein n=1 Tax=Kwoniella shandongensis TaxID=1734106 RepID=A0A5M6C672_9TREE|nr:uncharacterized protein CI109_000786 [Kwoniella shandongensis]KAA5530608.1 hypothetical protein CI109_000786 [Kwoniella shandongensis]